MRQTIFVFTALAGLVFLSACAEKNANYTVERAFQDANFVYATNLTDVMLTVADPNEAVNYFKRSIKKDPKLIDFQRGLALGTRKTLYRSRDCIW